MRRMRRGGLFLNSKTDPHDARDPLTEQCRGCMGSGESGSGLVKDARDSLYELER